MRAISHRIRSSLSQHSRSSAGRWRNALADADLVIIGSYVPEGIRVGGLAQSIGSGIVAFYDIDTPVTLASLANGDCPYINRELVAGFDLYLSFTGGRALQVLERRYRARGAGALLLGRSRPPYADCR